MDPYDRCRLGIDIPKVESPDSSSPDPSLIISSLVARLKLIEQSMCVEKLSLEDESPDASLEVPGDAVQAGECGIAMLEGCITGRFVPRFRW